MIALTHSLQEFAHRKPFLMRKLHSLTGVVPVGVFLVTHLWTNATVLRSQASFDAAVGKIQQIPFLPWVELFGVLLPLSFHALYGIALSMAARPDLKNYPHSRNWAYAAQRATGIIVFAFVLWHLWELRAQKAFFGMRTEAFYPTLAAHLSSTQWGVPWLAIAYMVGLASATFHLANGAVGFAASWGIATSRASQKRVTWVAGIGGTLLFIMGAMSVVSIATGFHFLREDARNGAVRAESAVTHASPSVGSRSDTSFFKASKHFALPFLPRGY